MNIKKIDGTLRAYKTSVDVVHGLDGHEEFLVSERVAKELRKSSDFLSEGYWYLAVGKDSTELIWEISVNGIPTQIPLKGHMDFDDGLPVLA